MINSVSESYNIVDVWNTPYTTVHNVVLADPHLTPAEKLIYLGLKSFSRCKNIHPGMSVLATRTALSRKTVLVGIRRLEKLGYLNVLRGRGGRKNGGATHIYVLTRMPKGCSLCVKAGVQWENLYED